MSGIPTLSKSEADRPERCPDKIRLPILRLRRWLFAGLVAATGLIGITLMFHIMRDGGVTSLEIVILVLFAATFSWISVPFWNAIIGFALTVMRLDPLSLRRLRYADDGRPITTRTALAVPIHNEDPSRVMAGLAATLRSLARTGQADSFDVFLLSDTTDPSIVQPEEKAWAALRDRMDHVFRLQYRRRPANVGRKAGNIADFCRRWGDGYDFMVVLDADSIMTGPALVRMVRVMEANPKAGLIQTLPITVRRTTLFGRFIQFASILYSPLQAAGQSFWYADTANYWGKNAIIRVKPFTEYCNLPVLPGGPPLGGAILSHDFVEAALMRRTGLKVYLLPSIAGSYEEAPENIVDYAKRDRRWSQGSLQHMRLLTTQGFHLVNRVHFLLGAAGYLISVVWLMLLLAVTAYFLLPPLSTGALISVPDGRIAGPRVSLLLITAVLLFLPRLLALVLELMRQRRHFGSTARLLISALVETLFAVMFAPLMMMYHTRFVMSVFAGHDVKWDAQVREGRSVGWREAAADVAWITVVGAVWAATTLYYNSVLFVWMTPIFTGMLLAALLIRWTSSRRLGEWMRRRGLFLVPSETVPPLSLQDSPRPGEKT